ncbi:MAG: class I SAM-dependent methyltransferase [Clostridiales bacterium]|nr:class I SAM-dependent methyltransferase [Clostridiales bacterium]
MPQYFEAVPETPSDRKVIDYRINGMNFRFTTDTAVFSKSSVDKGTELLLEAVIDDIKSRGAGRDESLLDLGCGWGVVGIVLKSVFTLFEVTSVDINSRAVALTRENARLNLNSPDKIYVSDVLTSVPEEKLFDTVVTNPPVRAGKKTVFAFYEQSYEHLKENGAIYVVLQRKQGADSTKRKLQELFGNCETISIKGGYHVMKSVKVNKDAALSV